MLRNTSSRSNSSSRQRSSRPRRQASGLAPARVSLELAGDEFHLHHRRIRYGRSTRLWRAKLVRRISKFPDTYARTRDLEDPHDIRQLLDEVITDTSVITHALHALYGTPNLGNVRNPVAELVFIVLCWRTRIPAARKILADLRRAFPKWERLADPRSRRRLERVLKPGGFVTNKATALVGIVEQLVSDFGKATLSPLADWSDEEALDYLTSLPGVDLKAAQCVLLYAFERELFPVDAHTIRVLSRLGFVEPLVGEIHDLEHRVVQRLLADAIPPRLRGPLHVNLVAHGRELCTARSPACHRCELQKFCKYWREGEERKGAKKRGPVLVDLFSGPGGFSEGFRRQGYRVGLAVDNDPSACRTYRFNHPEVDPTRVVCDDMSRLVRRKGLVNERTPSHVDVLAAGLPCQGFSKAGYRSKPHLETRPTVTKDPRNGLFRDLLKAVDALEPRAVLVENVPDMRSAGDGRSNILGALERGLSKRHYWVQSFGLNAERLGIPQVRHRLFVVAVRGDTPPPDAKEWLLQQFGVNRSTSLDEALDGLPTLAAGEGSPITTHLRGKHRSLLLHHEAREHNPLDLELFSLLEPGDDARVAFERGGPRLMRYSRDNFHDKYFRLHGDGPCRTIVSHLHKDANGYIHPHEDRGITIREAARIQAFPDDWVFFGSRCDQYIQVGNAVPPTLAECFAAYFQHTKRRRTNRSRSGGRERR